MQYRILSLIGLVVFTFLAWLISEDRKKIKWRVVYWGIGLQVVFALFILKTPIGLAIFNAANSVFSAILNFSNYGASFLFGKLTSDTNIGAIVAFQVLPIIIFVSSLASILYYFGVIQFIVNIIAWVMQRTMKISGVEAFNSALQIFTGIESTPAIKPYLEKMTRSEIFVMMVGFMATIASSVMAAYVSFGASAGHLLTASVMAAPAAVVIAKIMIPETGEPQTLSISKVVYKSSDSNIIEAAANGAYDGLKLSLSVGAMLIAFVSLIWMINGIFGLFGTSFDKIIGYLFSPFAFLMGIPLNESIRVGQLLGTKTVFNEFLAYLNMKDLIANNVISSRSITIATYALCGFSNFGSIAILIGGVGAIAPSRKKEVTELGIKSLIAGTLATFMTACIAGILI
jgi:CNT family concentrative nucleoside transporter